MRLVRKRKIASWLLLSVFVPMMILGVFHHHADDTHIDDACVECLHHVHHAGHISASSTCMQSCVLCHMLNMPFLAASSVVLTVLVSSLFSFHNQSDNALVLRVSNIKSSRAPPFLF